MSDWKPRMEKAVRHLAEQLAGIRPGTLSVGFIETFRVAVHGNSVALGRMASVSNRGDRIIITPFDSCNVPAVVKSLMDARLNAYALDPRTVCMIVILGDSINRGPDSRGVLDCLIDLSRRCRLVPILGNHDQMLLDVRSGKYPIFWLLDMGGTTTLDSYGPDRDLDLIPGEHYKFLEDCRDFHETDTHIFVHANYFPDIPMAEQHVGMLRWESLRDMIPGPHESGKAVIVGHTSQKGAEILDLGHLKCIDTYCYGGGWLTALEVRTEEVWQADREGRMRRN